MVDWSKLFAPDWEPSEADWRELETGAPRCTGDDAPRHELGEIIRNRLAEERRRIDEVLSQMIERAIFLDFDGVLHPAGGPPGESLPFCWVPDLAEELARHPDVGIVIHSSWIEKFTLEDFREFLSPLGQQVIAVVALGAKADSILSFVQDHPKIRRWLVIDDDASQFGLEFENTLLVCDPRSGISDPQIRKRLREWLTQPKDQTENSHG